MDLSLSQKRNRVIKRRDFPKTWNKRTSIKGEKRTFRLMPHDQKPKAQLGKGSRDQAGLSTQSCLVNLI